MTETQTEEADLKEVVSKVDDDGSNPFWPKGAGGTGQPDSPDAIAFDSITFDQADSANVTVNAHTTPAGLGWTINWGDGTADVPIAAGTTQALHTYADKSAGKSYNIKITNGPDSDTRNLQY
jgi:hypothetical protein